MIDKLRAKVFMIVMSSLSIIIISLVLVINVINYNQNKNESYMVLDNAVEIFRSTNYAPNLPMINSANMNKKEAMLYWRTSQFYFVIVKDNVVLQTINQENQEYSDEQINEYALQIIDKNKKNGTIKNLVYSIKDLKNYKIITFMNNEIINKRLKDMLILSILIGLIFLAFVYIISRKISMWIVTPIENTFNKQKQFISDASHELKTPLAVICANADVLQNEIGENKWLNYIQKEIISMDKLVNDLLYLARVEDKKHKQDEVIFDMSKVVLGTTMSFESLSYEKEISLVDEIQENLTMKGNSQEIKQLLSILLDNAIKHTPVNGKIIVSLTKTKYNTVLKVKNNGDEIPKEHRDSIFERFYRNDESRNREEKRYGLGLAIAKSIVEKYDGKISVSCQGGFTIFSVII